MPLSRAAAIKAGKRWLYIGHRWTGIALCLLFAIWFVSGVVMLYVPFPSFRAEERVTLAPPIRWDAVRIGPDQALDRLGLAAFPEQMRLEMTGGEPVYRVATDEGRRAVSAATGREITGVDAARATAIAEALLHIGAVRVESVTRDQWTVTRAFAKIAPFWRIRMADKAETDLYVARRTGEVVQNTTAHERFWNWLGAVPHWIYFSALRVYQEPWRQTVLWTSGIGILGAIAGIWIGLLRVRLSRRYASGAISPYRGWMKWHHLTGLVGGLFVVTWIFSGWLSMSPFGGFRSGNAGAIIERYAGVTGPRFAATDMAMLARRASGAREVGFTHIGGRPVMTIHDGRQPVHLLDGHDALPVEPALSAIEAIARHAVPDGRLVSVERLERYDRYWYSTGNPRADGRTLPVLRLRFDDPAETWLHVDPATGLLLGQTDKGGRSYRWLFSALHRFDLPLLLQWWPLRDIVVWLFSAFGLAVSVTGVVIGWRRLRADVARSRKAGR